MFGREFSVTCSSRPMLDFEMSGPTLPYIDTAPNEIDQVDVDDSLLGTVQKIQQAECEGLESVSTDQTEMIFPLLQVDEATTENVSCVLQQLPRRSKRLASPGPVKRPRKDQSKEAPTKKRIRFESPVASSASPAGKRPRNGKTTPARRKGVQKSLQSPPPPNKRQQSEKTTKTTSAKRSQEDQFKAATKKRVKIPRKKPSRR